MRAKWQTPPCGALLLQEEGHTPGARIDRGEGGHDLDNTRLGPVPRGPCCCPHAGPPLSPWPWDGWVTQDLGLEVSRVLRSSRAHTLSCHRSDINQELLGPCPAPEDEDGACVYCNSSPRYPGHPVHLLSWLSRAGLVRDHGEEWPQARMAAGRRCPLCVRLSLLAGT